MRPRTLPKEALIDAHVHLVSPEGIESIRSAGIAAVRDAGHSRNAFGGQITPGPGSEAPVLVRSLWALHKRGGYGSLLGVAVDTKGDITAQLDKLKQSGADIIKVMASGMVSFEKPSAVTPGGFDAGEMTYIVRESARLGLEVMAHANGEPALAAAARAGVRSIEHGFFMTKGILELMAEKGIFWTPTIGALNRAAAAAGKAKAVESVIGAQLRMLNHAFAIGVPLAIGTDCVLPDAAYEAAYREELDWFVRAGISRESVMKIAREGGARLIGMI